MSGGKTSTTEDASRTSRRPTGTPRAVRSFWVDVGRSFLVSLLGFGLFGVVVGLFLGWGLVLAYAFAFPFALLIVVPVVVAVVFPMFSAREVGVAETGFELVRSRKLETLPWSSLRLGSRARWNPFFGRRYLAVVEPPGAKAGRLLVLTPGQFDLLDRFAPRQRDDRPGRRRRPR